MDKLTNINWRTGFRMDIINVLDEIEEQYRADLKATIEAYDSIDEITNETYNDNEKCKTKIQMLLYLGYVNEDEFVEMCEYADDIRKEILEKEGEENGSKEN